MHLVHCRLGAKIQPRLPAVCLLMGQPPGLVGFDAKYPARLRCQLDIGFEKRYRGVNNAAKANARCMINTAPATAAVLERETCSHQHYADQHHVVYFKKTVNTLDQANLHNLTDALIISNSETHTTPPSPSALSRILCHCWELLVATHIR